MAARRPPQFVLLLAALLAAVVAAGCGTDAAEQAFVGQADASRATTTTSSTTTTSTTTTSTTTTTSSTTTTVAPTTTPRPPPTTADSGSVPSQGGEAAAVSAPTRSRNVYETAFAPFAATGGVVLHHPASRVEVIGFHESNVDGAQPLETLPTSAPTVVLETRGRDTTPRGSADVVADPAGEIRSPVTGRVLEAGTYVLYCRNSDDYVVIEPDAHPGWRVKVLHISGVTVSAGARVEAGVTVIAPRPTRLPFKSQVEDHSAPPVWPHVHVEVVDPSIPDRPSKDGC